MLGEQTGLFETVRIHQRFHPVARRQLAALALLFQPVRAAAQHGFAGARAKFGDSLLHGMNGHMKFLSIAYCAGATVTLCVLPLHLTS